MPFQVSPGVSIREIDLTTTVPSVSTTDGGTVIDADWGPVDLVTLISTEQELVSIFGRPNANIADSRCVSWLGAANFLSYSNKLRVIRANAVVENAGSGFGVHIKNFDHYNESYLGADNDGTTGARFAARYPGFLGNSLRVAIADSNSAFSNSASAVVNAVGHTMTTGQTTIYVGGTKGIDSNVIEVGDFISFPANSYPSQRYRVTAIASVGRGSTIEGPDFGANSVTISPGLVEDLTQSNTPVRRDWAYSNYFDSTPTVTTWAAAYDEAAIENDALHVLVFDADGGITGEAGGELEPQQQQRQRLLQQQQ